MNDILLYEPFKTRPLSDWYPELRFEFPDLPLQLWDYYLVKTAIMLAKRGNFVRRKITLKAQNGVTRYSLKSPDGLDICGILSLRRASHCGNVSDHIPRTFDAPSNATHCAKNVAWYNYAEDVFEINDRYCSGFYFITVAVTPRMGACELPDVFYTDLMDPMLYGTKGAVLMISGRPWTNLQLGKTYMDECLRQMSLAAQDALSRKQRGIVRMNFGKVM